MTLSDYMSGVRKRYPNAIHCVEGREFVIHVYPSSEKTLGKGYTVEEAWKMAYDFSNVSMSKGRNTNGKPK